MIQPDVWKSVFSNLLYDTFKYSIMDIVRKTRSTKYASSLKISIKDSELILENENISEEVMIKAFDTFKDITLTNIDKEYSLREQVLNKVIVYANDENGEVEILNQIEFITKHVANKNSIR